MKKLENSGGHRSRLTNAGCFFSVVKNGMGNPTTQKAKPSLAE
jgi:hypothetical protein